VKTSPTLKPCPFCGGDQPAVFLPTCRPETPYNPADRLYPVVRCTRIGCIAEVAGKNEDYNGKTAIEAWNRRHSREESQTGLGDRADGLHNDPRPWLLFYRDGKSLGEIAAELGCSIYALSPWLTAPLVRAFSSTPTSSNAAASNSRDERAETKGIADG